MCGIGGWLGNLANGNRFAERLVSALHHRGPDAHGVHTWPEATLVHTRLSVIDLSEAGSQPMSNEDGTVWTVFNGEIYNHGELQRYLESRGHVFRGRSDTEVLPHLYEEMGPKFVHKLRGMFAFAIYDTRSRVLMLARDRFGIKPLFYAPGQKRIAFASEIRALLELPDIDTRPDRQAIFDFAALSYIPAPETFYKGIRSLQPGEILHAKLDNDEITFHKEVFHGWTIAPNPALTLDEASDRADELLTAGVLRQLESDVPLGTLLSGGIDSSLVSTAAQQALSNELRTFNVRFAEKEYDETWAALAVSQHIGSQHETLDIGHTTGTWEHVTGLLSHAGQPFADTSLFAVNAVCNLMRQRVKVALSGDGGDEAFGGYDFYWRIARVCQVQQLPRWLLSLGYFPLVPLAKFDLISRSFPERFRGLAFADDTSIVQEMFCWVREPEHRALCLDTDVVLPVRRLFESQWEYRLPKGSSRLERLSALATEANIRLMLSNDFLFKVDNASMKEGLEVRVPMLDEDLFTFGLTLPHNLKVNGRTGKRVLREVASHRLPPAVANKPKLGFSIPVDSWVNAEFKTHLREVLLGRGSSLPEYFRAEVYRPMVEAFCDGSLYPGMSRQGLYQRAIMLLSVHLALSSNRMVS